MKTAKERLAAIDDLPASELCGRTTGKLDELVAIMNQETTLLRAGRMREAGVLTADKTRLAQDYVSLARSVQRQIERLKREAPNEMKLLRNRHERLATQMADNLRVIATARTLTENLLTDVANSAGQAARTRTYGATGEIGADSKHAARGIAVNRAL